MTSIFTWPKNDLNIGIVLVTVYLTPFAACQYVAYFSRSDGEGGGGGGRMNPRPIQSFRMPAVNMYALNAQLVDSVGRGTGSS